MLKLFHKSTWIVGVFTLNGGKWFDTCNMGPVEIISVTPGGHKDYVTLQGWNATLFPEGNCSCLLVAHPTYTRDIAGGKMWQLLSYIGIDQERFGRETWGSKALDRGGREVEIGQRPWNLEGGEGERGEAMEKA